MDTDLRTNRTPRSLVALFGLVLVVFGLFAGMLGGYVLTGDCGARGSSEGLWLVLPAIMACIGGVILIARALRD